METSKDRRDRRDLDVIVSKKAKYDDETMDSTGQSVPSKAHLENLLEPPEVVARHTARLGKEIDDLMLLYAKRRDPYREARDAFKEGKTHAQSCVLTDDQLLLATSAPDYSSMLKRYERVNSLALDAQARMETLEKNMKSQLSVIKTLQEERKKRIINIRNPSESLTKE